MSYRILVVDDEPSIRITFREFLRSSGYEVHIAESADTAIDILSKEPIDIVVTDIIMPRITGLTLLKHIKETAPHVEVIIMTGEPTVDTASEALRVGACDYLTKPVDKDALLRSINMVCKVKSLRDDHRRLDRENQRYQHDLQKVIEERSKTLKESEELLRHSTELGNVAVWEYDFISNTMSRSKNHDTLYGLEWQKVWDIDTFLRCTHPDDRQLSNAMIQDAVAPGGPDNYKFDFRVVHPDGSIHWLAVVGQVVERDDQGQGRRVRGALIDITDRKHAEEERFSLEAQLRQSQKLEAVGVMAGGIAHDFNNILQALFLYADIVGDQLPDDQDLRENFSHIIESAERAKELVKQILTFSRSEDMELRPIKIQYLLKDVLKLVRASTPTTIEIENDIEGQCGAVMCNSTQIHQVIVNLCNNAVQAMEGRDGTLSVSLRELEAQIQVEPGKALSPLARVVELIVADTGHGMDADTMELIFDPFFTTKAVGQGTGLGLSIVHGIIKAMQGEIQVSSEPGQGSRFRILLPLSKKEALEPALVPAESPIDSLRILYVEDDPLIATAAKTILEAEGHQVTLAHSGSQALALYKQEPGAIDLIITNLVMHDLTGLELGKAVRRISQEIPLILTSGSLDFDTRKEYRNLGFNGLVKKPWTAAEMVKTINHLMLK